ncbi:MAG TPA: patatin-like phospholipase family protein, partial [Salinimicrobium sp.]|nr:patatin-like phospholipase family protein [Salinimicrobium sp.]
MKKILLIFVIFGCLTVSAQQKEDPTVGLVLSGGGAKGLAHIGALKIIEEAGIQIDYIGGTSMGAIVGGLYAAGYSAEQLDSLFRET